jgi:hypothetical protein
LFGSGRNWREEARIGASPAQTSLRNYTQKKRKKKRERKKEKEKKREEKKGTS